jgi:AcrR family transcriptional regulator
MPAAQPKTRWGDRAQRRHDLLAAARRLLEKRGYEALSIRDVARGAGVSPGLVYTYFNDREELFAALYAERLARFHEEIAPICARARTPEALFVGIADAYRDVYRVYGQTLGPWAALAGAHGYSTEVAEPLVAAATQVIGTVLEAAERVTRARGFSLAALAEQPLVAPLLWATMTGLADQFTSQRNVVHARGWDELVAFAARVLTAGLAQLAATTGTSTTAATASATTTTATAATGRARRRRSK